LIAIELPITDNDQCSHGYQILTIDVSKLVRFSTQEIE
jgi:hypothetical protein